MYLWKQRYFVHPVYIDGALAIMSGPVESLDLDVEPSDLAAALRRAFAASIAIKRRPDANSGAAVLRALGAKSWLSLERTGRCMHASLKEDEIGLTPLVYWENPAERERGLRGEVTTTVNAKAADESLGATLVALLNEGRSRA